jgi:hypothetical protein
MICRVWRGWTTRAKVPAYQAVVLGQVIPGIEARAIAGFEHIDLMRRGGLTPIATAARSMDRLPSSYAV